MGIKRRIQQWRAQRRRKKAAETPLPLREFVYLDEVSVLSLLASRLGFIAEELTETESQTLSADVGGRIGIDMVGLESRVSGSEGRGRSIVRRSIIQSKFRELHEIVRGELAVSLASSPAIGQVGESRLVDFEGRLSFREPALQRGCLLEARVVLSAEAVYQISAAASALLEILARDAEVLGREAITGLHKAETVGRVLSKLMAGLIPVRGRLVDYKTGNVNGERWLAHVSLAERIQGVAWEDVYAVGIVDEGLFWKDTRRVLFTEAPCTALCRIEISGISLGWRPLKIANMLATVSPDMGRGVDSLSALIPQAIQNARAQPPQEPPGGNALESLHRFYELALQRAGKANEADVTRVEVSSEILSDFEDLETRRRGFDAVAAMLRERHGVELGPEERAGLREEVWPSAAARQVDELPIPNTGAPERIHAIECEFVAIYW